MQKSETITEWHERSMKKFEPPAMYPATAYIRCLNSKYPLENHKHTLVQREDGVWGYFCARCRTFEKVHNMRDEFELIYKEIKEDEQCRKRV